MLSELYGQSLLGKHGWLSLTLTSRTRSESATVSNSNPLHDAFDEIANQPVNPYAAPASHVDSRLAP